MCVYVCLGGGQGTVFWRAGRGAHCGRVGGCGCGCVCVWFFCGVLIPRNSDCLTSYPVHKETSLFFITTPKGLRDVAGATENANCLCGRPRFQSAPISRGSLFNDPFKTWVPKPRSLKHSLNNYNFIYILNFNIIMNYINILI